MKISIIIPVYKVEKYLRRCLESVINQTHRNIEIILINDGSPDKCGEICDQYAQKDSRIIVIHKDNEGVSEARNSGIKMMTGEYLYFLDSDDFIEKDTLSILYSRAVISGADIIIGNFMTINENNQSVPMQVFHKERLDNIDLTDSTEKFKYFFGKSYGVQVWNKLYKSQFVKLHNVFFEKRINYAEDLLYNLKLFIHHPKIELVNNYTYYYFKIADSITNSYKNNLNERYFYLLESFYSYARAQNKLVENGDLIAYSAFTAIDNCMLNAYQYNYNRFAKMKSELRKFKESAIINKAINEMARGKYLREVPRRDWKYYSWIFAALYSLGFLNLTTLIQLFRFSFKYK